MEKQVQKIKLNVTNIRSVLINSNKKLRNLESKKSYLIRRKEEKEERLILEKKIETPRKIPKIPLLGKAVGVVRSIWDRIVNFFGWILAGFVVTKLPQIVERLKSAYEFVKPIWEGAMKTFAIIGNGMSSLFKSLGGLLNLGRSESELQKNEKQLKSLEKEVGTLNKDLKSVQIKQDNSSENNQRENNISNNNQQVSNTSNIKPISDPTDLIGNDGWKIKNSMMNSGKQIKRRAKKINEEKEREIINPRLDAHQHLKSKGVNVKKRTMTPLLNRGIKNQNRQIIQPVLVEKNKFHILKPSTWFGGNKTTTSQNSTNSSMNIP